MIYVAWKLDQNKLLYRKKCLWKKCTIMRVLKLHPKMGYWLLMDEKYRARFHINNWEDANSSWCSFHHWMAFLPTRAWSKSQRARDTLLTVKHSWSDFVVWARCYRLTNSYGVRLKKQPINRFKIGWHLHYCTSFRSCFVQQNVRKIQICKLNILTIKLF